MCVVCGMGLMWSIATALRSSIISVFVQLFPFRLASKFRLKFGYFVVAYNESFC